MSEWQPIKTAPKGGYIIGAWKDGSWWSTAEVFNEDGDWVDVRSDRIHRPTRWMPLPDAARQAMFNELWRLAVNPNWIGPEEARTQMLRDYALITGLNIPEDK